LGASGAVSAIVFAGIFLYPTAKIGIFILPPFIPGFIFAPIYLFISAYLAKKGGDNINHSAHIWGSIYGILFLIGACYLFSDFDPMYNFTESIKLWLK
jgi:membrane associated rhomboid family serine protease